MSLAFGLLSDISPAEQQIWCVTFNRGHAITLDKMLRRFNDAHPIYNPAAIDA